VIEIARDVDIGAIMRRRIERSAHETRHGSVIEQRFYAMEVLRWRFIDGKRLMSRMSRQNRPNGR
jgi:hypothetical protein